MNVRINGMLRDKIVKAAVGEALDKRLAKLKKTENALALAVLKRLCGKDFAMLDKAPRGFFLDGESISLGAGGQYSTLRFDGVRPVPACARHGCRVLDLPAGDALADKIIAFHDATKQFERDRAELISKINAVIESVSTVKKLLEVWPESKKFLPAEALAAPERTLPTIIIADINKRIAELKAAA